MKKLIKLTILLLTITLFSCTNSGDKFLGTYVYTDGESDFYRLYKVMISKNGEDYLLTLYRGRGMDGQYRESKAVGKINGSSIEISNMEKFSLIENGTTLIYNGPSDFDGREFLKQK